MVDLLLCATSRRKCPTVLQQHCMGYPGLFTGMLAARQEVPGSGQRSERRAFRACHHCIVGKRQCDNVRPCSSCCTRGFECKEAPRDETCSACKSRKIKCDKQRPCGRCCRTGMAAECRPWLSLILEQENSHVRRPPDAASEDDPFASEHSLEQRKRSDMRPSLVSIVALPRKDKSARPLPSTGQSVTGARFLFPSALSGTAEFLSPERPLSFPDHPFPAWSQVISHQTQDFPITLQFVFKLLGISPRIFERILANMTPKLRFTIMRVFRACDEVMAISRPQPPSPEPPKRWALKNNLWKNSNRCGRQTVRFDQSFRLISGLDVNSFWSDLAGLHREEFIARAFSGENLIPTSELRQTCKLFKFYRSVMKALLQTPGFQGVISEKPTYMRWSRDWGRHGLGPGVLLRMSVTFTLDPEKQWVYLQASSVEVTVEEYEAARALDPDACEGYMIPVVGSKSASELLMPTLAEDESFAVLNSSPAGREALDRFADTLESDFAFVFSALNDATKAASP